MYTDAMHRIIHLVYPDVANSFLPLLIVSWLQQVNAEGQPADWQAPSSRAFILFMGAAMSFTAFPVLASLLSSAGLLAAPIGIQVRDDGVKQQQQPRLASAAGFGVMLW